ncbi:MAG: hypothetical protein GY859_15315, partial [Desulfobacterales bacterium]|nr:hypothetical protein [Desulfobacterales bacterium]
MHKINVEITFFNPFRVVPWRKRGERDADPLYSRGGGFARWHMKKEETGLGRPYITGTLVRSALYAEVEKLLVLEKPARHFGCCDGVDKTPGERKPHFLRKRPRFGEERETEPCGTCPLCRLLGRGDAHRGPDKFKDQRYENGTVHFENFWESGDRRFFWKDVAQRRVLNRVDHSCGKAKDYYDIWEIDPANCARFSGRVRINEANLTGEELEKVRELMALGLAHVNILAGAICRVDMVSESHDDAIRRFWRHDEAPPPPDVRPGDAPEIYEMGGLDKLARIMATAFEESQRRAFLRRLADAVRDLRRHGPDFLDQLPEGKTDDRPSVWNKTTDQGYTLLELLQMQARHIGDGPWRQFCENLGMALYREQKNLENRAESKPRLLGETRLHGLPMRRDKEKRYETPFQSKKSFPAIRWLIAGELTAVTPFFLGAESDVAHAGGCVLLSRDRSFRLPRSAVRGALRRDLGLLMGDACNARVGGEICTCGACRTMRNVVIEDAFADFRKPPEVRHRIRLNCHTGVVEEGALFDMETGLQGLTFPFRMHYASIEPMLPDHLWRVLEYWREKRAFIGGAIGAGFGRFQLTLSNLYLWDLTEEEDCAQYQLARGFKGFSMDALKKLTPAPADLAWKNAREESSAPPDPMPWKKIAYTITMTSPLLSRDPIAAMFHPDAPDAVMVHKTVVSRDKEGRIRETPRPLVKSESIRGALRAIVSRNKVVVERPPGEAAPVGEEKTRSLFDLDHEDCDCIQCRLFGSVHQQGRLRFEDAEVQGKAPARKMDHVAIDRYTGGGVDRLKFDDYPLTPGEGGALTLKGVFWIRGALSDEERTALTSALSEIKSGLISLGGLGAIGYGRVKTFEITRGADILDTPEWRFHPVPGAGRVSMKPPPGPGIAPGKIYHPHYFIPPAPRLVEREASPAPHAMDADHEGAPLFSGKLACTLTTRGPIFIPDAAN